MRDVSDKNNSLREYCVAVISVLFSFTVVIVAIAALSGLETWTVLRQFVKAIHVPCDVNHFTIGRILGVSAYTWLYVTATLAASMAAGWSIAQQTALRSFAPQRRNAVIRTVLCAVSAVFILCAAMQSAGRLHVCLTDWRFFSARPWPERVRAISPTTYDFAAFCHERLPGPHRARFVTGLDLTRDPGMTIHRHLAYHIYPIDIRGVTERPFDCVVVFEHVSPESVLPTNTVAIARYSRTSLIATLESKQP